MGAGASAAAKRFEEFTAEEIGNAVAALGDAYAEYKARFIENGVDGHLLSSLNEEELVSSLEDLQISKKIHQRALLAQLQRLRNPAGTAAAAASASTSVQVPATAPVAGAPTTKALHDHIDFGSCEKITATPRSIMTRLFQIQGISLDPTDMDPAINKIINVVGKGSADGLNSYDCFINYRVASDADLAEKLYLYLKASGINAFLDKKCLKDGQDWKEGFIQGLKRSRIFVALISSAALANVKNYERDHSKDNVLLEYELALKIREESKNPNFICPIHVAALNNGMLAKFSDFNPTLYPDSIMPQPKPVQKETPKQEVVNTKANQEVSNTNVDEYYYYHPKTWEIMFLRDDCYPCCNNPNKESKGCLKRKLSSQEIEERRKGIKRYHPGKFEINVLRDNAWDCCGSTDISSLGCKTKSS